MSDRRPFPTFSLLMAALLIVPVLATAVSAQAPPPVSAGQQTSIENRIDPNAPFGAWEERIEETRFYLRADGAASPVLPTNRPGGSLLGYDMQRPTGATVTGTVGLSEYILESGPSACSPSDATGEVLFRPTVDANSNVNGATKGPVNLYEFDVLVYSDAPSGTDSLRLEVYDVLTGTESSCAVQKVADFNLRSQGAVGGSVGGLSSGAVIPHEGRMDITTFDRGAEDNGGIGRVNAWGPEGYPMATGNSLLFVLSAIKGEHRFYFDSPTYPSYVEVTADSARTNLWTENLLGEVTTSFPGGAGAPTEERRVVFNAVVADQFGLLGCAAQLDENDDHDPNKAADLCPGDAFEEDAIRFRVRDLNPSHRRNVDPTWDQPWQYNDYIPLDQGLGIHNDKGNPDPLVGCCNLEIEPIVYDPYNFNEAFGATSLQYTFVYGADFPSGRYQIEMHEAVQNWKVYTTFDVGNTGFSFEFAPGEEEIVQNGEIARHMVRVGEPTEYVVRVTNGGAVASTYGLSVPTPGKGWIATVQPNNVVIQPGAYHDFTLTVTPPSTGLAGDVKVIEISAVSIADNTVKTLITETTLTGEIKLGVDLLESLSAVRTRPDRTESFPVLLRNTGTVQGDFVLTTEGIPPGWRVDVTPSFTHVLAASREDILVQVYAPSEATPPLDPSRECGLPDAEENHPGCSWSLLLTAQHVVDNLVSDTLEIPVSVFLIDGFLATPINSTIRMHDVAGDRTECPTERAGCIVMAPKTTHADATFDDTAVFRVQVDNTGDRPDNIRISASWLAPTDNCPAPYRLVSPQPEPCEERNAFDDTDISGCDGGVDGAPDGWRFRIVDGGDAEEFIDPNERLDGFVTTLPSTPQNNGQGYFHSGLGNSFAGEWRLGDLRLPPHESQDIYIEMGWLDLVAPPCEAAEEDSWRDGRPSREARLRVTFRSENDPALRQVEVLNTILTPVRDPADPAAQAHGHPVTASGVAAGAIHDVRIERGLNEVERKSAPVFDPENATGHLGATYRVRVTNIGNEHDDVVIRVDQGFDGWTHYISHVGPPEAPRFLPVPTTPTSLPASLGGDYSAMERPERRCTAPEQNDREITCYHMGVGDVVELRVRAIPPLDADVGDVDRLTVTATGTPVGETDRVFAKTIEFLTRVRGEYFYNVEDLAGERVAYPGQSIAFPFSIHNVGDETDTYQLTIREMPDGWTTRFGTAPLVRVPAGHSFHGFLATTVPIDAETGDQKVRADDHFRIQIRSTESPAGRQQTELLDFFAVVEDPPDYRVSSEALTVRSGDKTTFRVFANQTEGGLGELAMEIDLDTVPDGFFYSCLPEAEAAIPPTCDGAIPEQDVRLFDAGNRDTQPEQPSEAIGDFTINAPPAQLGTSRVISRITTVADGDIEEQRAWHDAVTNLASTYGVSLSVVEKSGVTVQDGSGLMVIRPGPEVPNTFTLRVANTGLTPQTVNLGNSPLPEGWTITPGTASGATLLKTLRVQPFDTAEVEITVKSPRALVGGKEATVLFFAEVVEDRSQRAQFPMTLRVGTYDVDVAVAEGAVDRAFVAPLEEAVFRLKVTNEGNVPDTVRLTHLAGVDPNLPKDRQTGGAYQDRFPVRYVSGCKTAGGVVDASGQLQCHVDLQPGQSRQVEFGVFVPNRTTPLLEIPMRVTASSVLSQFTVTDDLTLFLQTLDYVEQDIDGDRVFEMAINRDQDGDNDYEEFRDPAYGVALKASPLASFLSDDARTRLTTKDVVTGEERFEYKVDVNGDGRTDHFLDDNNDGLPDIYWDPYHRWFHRLVVTKDVNNDGFREYFIDKDGNCQLDAYFDVVDGKVGALLRVFVDDDDKIDYVVDRNGNNFADDADIILLGSKGAPEPGEACDPERGFLGVAQIIQRVDMNGDGALDLVVDTDADGDPDHFIPNGKTNPIIIVLQDVTGDKHADWTYASRGQGDPDSYYDPVTGKSGFIDTQSQFLRELQEYWWVAVLFGFVLVLFIVLVAVTRR